MAPAVWRSGNPRTWVDRHPPISALLIHGGADATVPASFTQEFGETLRAAGHGVSIKMLADADHDDVYQADLIAPIVTSWIRDGFS
jgi:acetyl esterase/lipase